MADTSEKVLERLKNDLPSRYDVSAGSYTYDIEKVHAEEFHNAYDLVENKERQFSIATATGIYLDRLVADFGVMRKDAVNAEGYVTIRGDTGAAVHVGDKVAAGISFACGYSNTALDYQTKCGHGATDGTAGSNSGTTGDAFTIGNGTVSTPSNAFRVSYSGAVYGKSAFNSTGADYAEFFEWLDGNSENADRTGLFVTLDGDKIRLANADDDYILGVISAAPGVIGNNHADTWQGMWLTDIFGRVLTHTVHHEAEYDDEGNLIHDACDAVEPIVNPDYNPDEKYIPREERKEWGIVGMMGQLVVIDDGTCKVNGNCTVSDGGTANLAFRAVFLSLSNKIV